MPSQINIRQLTSGVNDWMQQPYRASEKGTKIWLLLKEVCVQYYY